MSNNEQILNSNEALVKFTSDYEYVLGATMGRMLSFQGLFHSSDFMIDQIEQIRYDLEETAKMFAEQQGLAPGAVGWGIGGWNGDGTPMLRYNTGNLYNNIKAVRTGRTVHLRSEARDKYGHYYGGHVEFGHGNVPARPHLRPALYAVSEASKGKLRSALQGLLTGAFNGEIQRTFGTGGGLSASYYRNGPGQVAKYMTTGTRGQQMKYHFGSIRNGYGRNVSRKGQSFRKSFSSTSKKTMGWKKQKSLNPAARRQYSRRQRNGSRAFRAQKQKIARRNSLLKTHNRTQSSRQRLASRQSKQTKINQARQQKRARRTSSGYRQLQNKREERIRGKQSTQNYIKSNSMVSEGVRGYQSLAGNSFLQTQNVKNMNTEDKSDSKITTTSERNARVRRVGW